MRIADVDEKVFEVPTGVKTGMFVTCYQDEPSFDSKHESIAVIVGDVIAYQNGGYDWISDLCFPNTDEEIKALIDDYICVTNVYSNVHSFDEVRNFITGGPYSSYTKTVWSAANYNETKHIIERLEKKCDDLKNAVNDIQHQIRQIALREADRTYD